jgi:hypothetical protein
MSVASYALSDLDSIKEWAGITASKQTDDDLLESLINNVSGAFIRYCKIDSFKAANYTEYIDGNGSRFLFVKNVPLNSITNIWISDDWDWDNVDPEDSTEYRIVEKQYIASLNEWSIGIQNIKITYNAGFSSVPAELTQACNEEAYRKYSKRREIDVQIKTLEDGSLHFPSTRFLDSTVQVLSKYKRIRSF